MIIVIVLIIVIYACSTIVMPQNFTIAHPSESSPAMLSGDAAYDISASTGPPRRL